MFSCFNVVDGYKFSIVCTSMFVCCCCCSLTKITHLYPVQLFLFKDLQGFLASYSNFRVRTNTR